MSDHRAFQDPASIADAISRKRTLERDIWNIERQLAEPVRETEGRPLDKKGYQQWRSKAHSSLAYKKAEQAFLKDWVTERRRAISADKLGIFNPNDPREILVQSKVLLKKVLDDGDDADLGRLYDVIEQYLNHAA